MAWYWMESHVATIALLALYIWQLITVKADHIALIQCGLMDNCLEHINEEIVQMMEDHRHNGTDPCENFWDYACGDWTAAPYYDHVDNFGAISNYYAEQMEIFLMVPGSRGTLELQHLLRKMSIYYRSCRTVGSYFLPINRYYDNLHNSTNVKWPNMRILLGSKPGTGLNLNWLLITAELRRIGLNGLFVEESVGWASNNSRQYVIELKMPKPVQHFHSKHEVLKLYQEFGWLDSPTDRHLEWAAKVYELDLRLRNLQSKHVQDSNLHAGEDFPLSYLNKMQEKFNMTLEQLKRKMPGIDWQTYFNIICEQVVTARRVRIELSDAGYFNNMAALLNQTNNQTILLYIVGRLCKYLLSVRPLITDKDCIEHMDVVMPFGMNFLYDRLVYQTRSRDEKIIGDIFHKLKLQFADYLRANKLHLSRAEIEYLQSKLDKMRLKIGNLPTQMNLKQVNHYYDYCNLTTDNFFHNHLEMLRFRTHLQHTPLLDGQRELQLDSYYVNDDIVQVRNAPYFVHQRNLLMVPLIFVMLPFYHHRQHPIFHYSLMGWILGHELNHAFESEGILYDADGNVNALGFTIARQQSFRHAMNCFRQRPSAAMIERIADVNGFQLVFDAFFRRNDTLKLQERLPDNAAHYSLHQLFFLYFAQFFCGKLPKPIDHDRDDVRTMEVVANQAEFAEAFNCSIGTREHPAEKCHMWRP